MDESTDDEFENNERKHMVRSKYTIFPESSVKTAWDVVGFIFIVF